MYSWEFPISFYCLSQILKNPKTMFELLWIIILLCISVDIHFFMCSHATNWDHSLEETTSCSQCNKWSIRYSKYSCNALQTSQKRIKFFYNFLPFWFRRSKFVQNIHIHIERVVLLYVTHIQKKNFTPRQIKKKLQTTAFALL